MPLSANGMRVVMRQLREIHAKPVDCIAVLPADDLSEVRFELDGPEGTPFADGRFLVSLQFDEQYPEIPPKGYFRTPIFHPNVAPETGDICVNALKRDWEPSMGIRHILVVIRCLLVEPNAESALNEVAGRLILEDYVAYERQALMMTRVHAKRPAGLVRHRVEENGGSSTAASPNPDADSTQDGKKKLKKEEAQMNDDAAEGDAGKAPRPSHGSCSSEEASYPLSATDRLLGATTASASGGVFNGDVPSLDATTITCSSLENTSRSSPQETVSTTTTAGLRNADNNTSAGLSNAERAKKRAAEKRKSALRRI